MTIFDSLSIQQVPKFFENVLKRLFVFWLSLKVGQQRKAQGQTN
jgi:hypothetical protein